MNGTQTGVRSWRTRDTLVRCESHVIDMAPLDRIEDEPMPGSRPCGEPAEWRVTFSGLATSDGTATLRLKCDDCAQSAVECFGDEVMLRRL